MVNDGFRAGVDGEEHVRALDRLAGTLEATLTIARSSGREARPG